MDEEKASGRRKRMDEEEVDGRAQRVDEKEEQKNKDFP